MEQAKHDIFDVIACMEQSQAALFMVMEHIDLHSKPELDPDTKQFLNDTYTVLQMVRNSIRTELDVISSNQFQLDPFESDQSGTKKATV